MRVRQIVPFAAAVLRGEILHREVHAVQLAPRHRQIAGLRGPSRKHDRVELRKQILCGDVNADVTSGLKFDAFLTHQIEPALEQPFLELELGNAVAKQPANAIRTLEHCHEVTRAIQLICRRET